MKVPAPYYALASAFLFAIGMPSAKLLLKHVDPIMLAGLLYLGSGIGLSCILFIRDLPKSKGTGRGGFSRRDFAWLAGSTASGGILAPLLLMEAMNIARASTVSLLLNFEVVFTALIAWLVFKEHLGLRVIIGLAAILCGGVSLSWTTDMSASWSLLLGIGACLCWAIDSNLAGQIVHSESIQIAQFRGLVAGAFNLCLALLLGYHVPDLSTIGWAAITGIVSYGISLSLFIAAMRRLGAARAMAYFSTEPFIGALLSVAILREPININLLLAAIFMSIGVWLHLTEKREHIHTSVPGIPDDWS